MYQRPL